MAKQEPKLDENLTDVPASGEDYSLEEILAEYGGSLEQTLLRGTELREEPAPVEEPPVPEAAKPAAPERPETPAAPPAAAPFFQERKN